jgi:hypothetical protein
MFEKLEPAQNAGLSRRPDGGCFAQIPAIRRRLGELVNFDPKRKLRVLLSSGPSWLSSFDRPPQWQGFAVRQRRGSPLIYHKAGRFAPPFALQCPRSPKCVCGHLKFQD